jgi:Uma2 family endonuclease
MPLSLQYHQNLQRRIENFIAKLAKEQKKKGYGVD